MTPTKRRTAAEIIAFALCYDLAEMSDYRYQATRYAVAVYAIGERYYCAPSKGTPPDVGHPWEVMGEFYGRKVYRTLGIKGAR